MSSGEVILGEHGRKNNVTPFLISAIVGRIRKVPGGGVLNDGHQTGGLRSGKILCRFTKIHLGCRLNTIGVAAKTGDVEVRLKNLILGVKLFEPNGELHLIEFATKTCFNRIRVSCLALLFCGQILRALNVRVFHQLHGERGRTTFDAARENVANARAQNGVNIDTGVVVKASVFTCYRGGREKGRHVIQCNFFAVLPIDLSKGCIAIGGVGGVLRPQGVLLSLLTQFDEFG